MFEHNGQARGTHGANQMPQNSILIAGTFCQNLSSYHKPLDFYMIVGRVENVIHILGDVHVLYS